MNERQLEIRAREILSRPIGEATGWFVIAGPPSAGKTTVLRELAARGFNTSHDVSREHLESRLIKGAGKVEIRQNEEELQRVLLWKMLLAEGKLPTNETVFLDYALPDNLAFLELSGLTATGDVWRAATRFRYKHIFILDALPFVEDAIRVETSAYQVAMLGSLKVIYGALGYGWTSVPAASVDERVSTVLNTVGRFATIK